MILLSGSSNRNLAQAIATQMGKSLGEVELSAFSNGERRVRIVTEVKGQDVALIQSFADPADSNIIEFALMIDGLFRQGARRVFAVIPWFGYSLQDKVFRPGEPIAAKVIASMLSSLSVYRFILMNVHNSSMAGFFNVPSSILSSDPLFIEDIKQKYKDSVVVSSDFGGLKRVGKFAQGLGLPIANIDKRRDLSSGEVRAHALEGDVKGKTALIIDDLINGGGTAVEAARILHEHGANKIVMYATHALFAGDCVSKLEQCTFLDEVVVTDTLNLEAKQFSRLRALSVAKIFATELQLWER